MAESNNTNKLYWLQRAEEIGLSEAENNIPVWFPGDEEPQIRPILSDDKTRQHNMLIMYLALEKKGDAYVALTYEGEIPSASVHSDTGRTITGKLPYYNTRLAKPTSTGKYKNPAGTDAMPFVPRMVVDAWASRNHIPTLILIEGSMKALKGSLHGLHCVGLNGIWGSRGKGSKELHPVVKQIIEACKVKNLVYLQDNDFREIRYDQQKDISERPKQFAKAVEAFQKASTAYKAEAIKPYYAHVLEGGPKGLDDLLIAHPGQEAEVAADLLELSSSGKFFSVKDLAKEFRNRAELLHYFYVDTANNFYDNHSGLLQDRDFIFDGDQYRYNEEEDELEMVLSGAVRDYVLVANKYFKNIYQLNSKCFPEPLRDIRNKDIIYDEFARAGFKDSQIKENMLKIPKYEGYVNEPDFVNYQREIAIHNFKMLNLAYPLEHVPAEGEWPNIQRFLEHIFHNGGDSKLSVGMDMIQMYYTKPMQIQRIMSLVSAANETGKTKFLELMRAIFGQNMSIIGSADFKSQFNPYVSKSLVGVDESKIDDPEIIEMIKSMVTNPYAIMNEKGVSATQIINRVKLIMTSNHIFDFANIKEEENKWFVIEVGQVKVKDSELMDKMQDEIPAFLWHLQNRKLQHYTTTSRFGIADSDVETAALKRIKDNSRPELMRLIQEYVGGRFKEFGETKIVIDAKRLHEQIFPDKSYKYSSNDIANTLKKEFGLKPSEKSEYFTIPSVVIEQDEQIDGDTGELLNAATTKVNWLGATGKAYRFEQGDWT